MTTKKRMQLNLCTLVCFAILCIYSCNSNTVSDFDGNKYTTITIGNQTWLRENLKTTKFNDGSPIATGFNDKEWAELKTSAYCIYPYSMIDGYNSSQEVLESYGALYNWHAVETEKLCPLGWKVPSNDDWSELFKYLGNKPITKLKANFGWDENGNGTDEYGFSALPSGYRFGGNGSFGGIKTISSWWSSTESDEEGAWTRNLDSSGVEEKIGGMMQIFGQSPEIGNSNSYKSGGSSVRCLKVIN